MALFNFNGVMKVKPSELVKFLAEVRQIYDMPISKLAVKMDMQGGNLSALLAGGSGEPRWNRLENIASILGYDLHLSLVKKEGKRSFFDMEAAKDERSARERRARMAGDFEAAARIRAEVITDDIPSVPELPNTMTVDDYVQNDADKRKWRNPIRPNAGVTFDWFKTREYLNYVELKKEFDRNPRIVENLRSCAAAKKALHDLGWSMNDRDEWCPPGSVAGE